jgi:hypothetical protein
VRRKKTVQLGQQWPEDSAGNIYWIGMDPMQSGIQYCGRPLILGRECRSMADLEAVASEIREDLDSVLEEARLKLRQQPK